MFPNDPFLEKREVFFQHVFMPIHAASPFDALHQARNFLKDQNYTFGSLDGDNPVAIISNNNPNKNDFPQKWHNFYPEGKKAVNGVMTSEDFRFGAVCVYLFDFNKEIEPIKAPIRPDPMVEMRMHEIKEIECGPITWHVTRVPGGWIYTNLRLDKSQMNSVFVPQIKTITNE